MKRRLNLRFLLAFVAASLTAAVTTVFAPATAAEPAPYRTDAGTDLTLPRFQPVRGEFPPEDAAHYFCGELIGGDFPERQLVMRVDRTDDQTRSEFDRPITATMLPYGTVYYHGQHASLRDVPYGTHLHGWFFERPTGEPLVWVIKNGKLTNTSGQRISSEIDFTRCLRLEDDFSYYSRRKQAWKVDAVDLDAKKLTATLHQAGKPIGEAKVFDLLSSTVVYQGRSFETLEKIQPGQLVQMNFTWATLYGPGRVLAIWLDEESRNLASARQLERHRNLIRERGIPGWVDAVDDKQQIVTITFFEGVDPTLFKDFDVIVPEPLGWPTSGGAKDDLAPKGTIAVARDCLMTYDPVNDRKGGNILKVNKTPVLPGSSGVQIQVQCGMLLEGYRPGGIVRFFPACWKVVALPKEEEFYGRD
ncbi:hypothetical protein [Lignipirellula cremea]|uniref:Uncharacterized protein n=1 Tax=Lignipirellula cremea TaxID=2528010 RepID=A0A518DLF5_9BACT|nr:hypothetical protein [Lignipirellula cremea]QDU92667.1 hypothetical protein Pla8534_04150 [Lignipirellula cremea]